VLRGLGTAISLPLLEAMSPSFSWAASAAPKPPLRMAFLYVPNGMHMDDWIPAKEGSGFEITPILKPVAKYRDKMNVLSGLTLNGARALGDGGGDHARSVASFLTGAHPKKTSGADIHNGASVDQVAAAAIGDKTRLPSLELGMESSAQAGKCDSGYSCVYTSNMCWRTDTSPVAKENNPAAVFDRLFGSSDKRENDKNKSIRDKQRKSVIDFALEDANDLRRTLGGKDKNKLDEYLHAIREIERRLTNSEKLRGVELDADYPRPEGVPEDFEVHMKLMFDLMVLSLQTDSTRIATFMYANAGSNRGYRNIKVSEGHHDLSHHGRNKDKQEKISKINQYHTTLLSYFLDKMEAVREEGSTLLDNSMIVYGSGIGDGDRHNHDNLPIALFGSGQGTIKTGRHLAYKKETPLTNLYVSMLDRMGVQVNKFSDSTGALPDLG
jgi:hypothetical protein